MENFYFGFWNERWIFEINLKRTEFRRVRLEIDENDVKIVRDDFRYAKTTTLGNNAAKKSPKALGTAGDCYSWNSCDEVRNGDFKIDIPFAEIDYDRIGSWKGILFKKKFPHKIQAGDVDINFSTLFQQTGVQKLYYFSTKFFETSHTWSSPSNATIDNPFLQNSFCFRFYDQFRVTLVLLLKNHRFDTIFTLYSSEWSVRPKHKFKTKNFGLRLNFKFGVIWGQISDIVQSKQIIPQNEALCVRISKMLVSTSFHA